MEIHVFAEKLRSYKELAVHYVLIVMGILTAMGLEQCNASRHHAQQAAAAEKAIVAELRGNLKTLLGTIDGQDSALTFLKTVETRLGEKTFAVPDLEARAQGVLKDAAAADVDITITLVSLRRTEWESAIASQTLQHMDKAKVSAFARAYAAIQEVASIARLTGTSSRSHANQTAFDMYDRGESKNALAFARALREMRMDILTANTAYAMLANLIRETLGDPAPAAAASAASR